MNDKILITTKQGFDFGSDSPGGNLTNILVAEYFKKTTNFHVEMYDPFYDLSKKVHTKFKIIDELTESKLRSYDRILDPFFYISSIKNNKKKGIKNFFLKNYQNEFFVEGRNKWKEYFDIKKKEIQLIQKKGFMASNYDDVNLYYKSLPSPYVYYYDLLYREKFISNLKLKENIKIPLIKNKITFAIQIKPVNHNKITIKDNLVKKDYYQFINFLTNKINTEFNFPNIIYYGAENDEFKELININKNNFLKKNIFLLENYSKTVLENSLTIAKNTDFLISTMNGFSAFTYYVGNSQGKIKNYYIINSTKEAKDHLISRRILQDGINENNADWKWFKTYNYYPKDTILKIEKKKLAIRTKKIPKQKNKKDLIIYETKELSRNYFSKVLDKLLLTELIIYIKKNYKRNVVLISKKNQLDEKLRFKIENNVNVLTHFNLIDKENNQTLGYGSLDFIKHDYIKSIQKKGLLNPSNYLYEDLSFFLIRELLKKKNKESIDQKNKIKNILIITSVKNLVNISDKSYYFKDKFNIDVSFVYIKNEKLLYENKKDKIQYILNKKNILKIISKTDCIICSDNYLSLFFHYYNKDKKIFFNFQNGNKKIFKENSNLFYSSNNLIYRKLFSNIYNNYYEIFLAITKKFVIRF